MPLYDVEHVVPLSSEQKDALADAITRVHSELFTTPRIFVNVKIVDVSEQITYMSGVRHQSNRIVGFLRPGRPQEQMDEVVIKLGEAWDRIVLVGDKKARKEYKLGAVFINASLVALQEKGVAGPKAGDDRAWLKSHLEYFRGLAEEGDEQCKLLMSELNERNLI